MNDNRMSFSFSQVESLSSIESNFFGGKSPGLSENHVIAIRQLTQAYLLANKIVDDAVHTLSEEHSQGYWIKLTGDMGNLYRLACAIAKNAMGATPWNQGKYEKAIDVMIDALGSQYLRDSSPEVLTIKNEYKEMVRANKFDLAPRNIDLLLDAADKLLFSKIS